MNYPTCLLCGITGPQVRLRMVEWLEPDPKRFEPITACEDRRECRERVEQLGDEWPIVDPEWEKSA